MKIFTKMILIVFACNVFSVYAQQAIGAFKEFDGGFEGQTVFSSLGSTTTLSGSVTSSTWTIGQSTGGVEAIVNNSSQARTGAKYAQFGYTSTSTKRFQSPTAADAAVASATSYVIQFYYRTNSTTAPTNLEVGVNPYGTSGTPGPTYAAASPLQGTGSAWQKASGVVLTKTSSNSPRYGIGMLRANTSMTLDPADIDDFVMYPGTALDETAPPAPSAASASSPTMTTLSISWSAPTDVSDVIGYLVVFGTSDPTGTPNANGIYVTGNSVAGAGTVAWVGNSTSFTHSSLSPGTNYYYRIYSVDQAFNYSGYTSCSGTTSSGSTTIDAGSTAEPATLSSVINTSGAAVINFDIKITDDGSSPGSDATPTKITQMVFNQGTGNTISDWAQAVLGAELSDGTTSQTGTVNSTNITFASLTSTSSGDFGYIDDNANKTYSLKIWLKTALQGSLSTTIDGLRFVFRITSGDITTGSGSSLFAGSQDVNSGSSNNLVDVTGTKIIFTSNRPTSTTLVNVGMRVEVSAQDANGNRDLGNTSSVSLSLASGMGALVSASGLTQNLVSGIFTWTDVTINVAGDFTISASDGIGGMNDALTATITASNSVAEDFNYTSGNTLTSSSANWTAYSGAGTNSVTVGSSGLTFAGYQASEIGKSASFQQIAGEDLSFAFPQVFSGTVYLSMMVNIGTGVADGHFLGLKSTSTSTTMDLRIYCSGTSSPLKFGLAGSGASAGNYGPLPTSVNIGSTALLVLKYTVGGTARLFVFPQGTSLPESEPGTYEVEFTPASFSPGSLYLRQDVAGVTGSLDGIRIATSWGNSPMPVELSSFSAKSGKNTISLMWQTRTELNFSRFEIERKSGSSWVKIADIQANGNSNSIIEYQFNDNKINTGKYFYRLKMVDNDGSFEYSPVVEAELKPPVEFQLCQNYPNPFNPATRISFEIPSLSRVKMEMYSISGELVAVLLNCNMEAGYYDYSLDMSKYSLGAGVYIYKISVGDLGSGRNVSATRKMIYLK